MTGTLRPGREGYAHGGTAVGLLARHTLQGPTAHGPTATAYGPGPTVHGHRTRPGPVWREEIWAQICG